MNNRYPTVSFIIPTLNAEKFLPRCLKAIRQQNYPKDKIEIIIADGGSTDSTRTIAAQYKAKIIPNPEILHEHGKFRASKVAHGAILFYTDADNILASETWIKLMIQPYLDNPQVKGFLPQTIPAPDSNSLDRFMGYLFTDPFTWFVYGQSANPRDYEHVYPFEQKTDHYVLYRFPQSNYPLFGLSQGVGVVSTYKRGRTTYADDILAGMKLIRENGLIAYVPKAGVYHYHITGFKGFISKYRWRIRNNFSQKVKGMGITNRIEHFDNRKKIRMALFIPYSFTLIFPIIDGLLLTVKYKDIVLLFHPIVCFLEAYLIFAESMRFYFFRKNELGDYK